MKRGKKRTIIMAPKGEVRSDILRKQSWILFKDHVVKSFQNFIQVKVPRPSHPTDKCQLILFLKE